MAFQFCRFSTSSKHASCYNLYIRIAPEMSDALVNLKESFSGRSLNVVTGPSSDNEGSSARRSLPAFCVHTYSSRTGNISDDGIANGMSETTRLYIRNKASAAPMGSNVIGDRQLSVYISSVFSFLMATTLSFLRS